MYLILFRLFKGTCVHTCSLYVIDWSLHIWWITTVKLWPHGPFNLHRCKYNTLHGCNHFGMHFQIAVLVLIKGGLFRQDSLYIYNSHLTHWVVVTLEWTEMFQYPLKRVVSNPDKITTHSFDKCYY